MVLLDNERKLDNTAEIAARIKQVRKALQLSQAEFAKELGFAQSLVAQLEAGNKDILPRHLNLLESAYGVRRGWLVTGDGEMFSEKYATNIDQMSAQKKAITDAVMAMSEEQCAIINKVVATIASNLVLSQAVELPEHLRLQVAKAFDDLSKI